MVSVPRRTTIVALLAVGIIVLGAFVVGVSVNTGSPDPAETRQRVLDANRSLESYAATLEVATTVRNRTVTYRFRVAADRSGRYNLTLVGPENRTGYTVLENGTGRYTYNRASGTLRELDEEGSSDVIGALTRLLSRDGSTFRGEDRIEGSPGVVLQYSAGDGRIGLRIGGSTPARQFDAQNPQQDANVSVWVDPELNLPVRATQTVSGEGWQRTTTMEVTNITLNGSFAPGRFRLGGSSTGEGPDPSAGDQRYEPGADVLPDPNPPAPAAFETDGGAPTDGATADVFVYAVER
jgi:outer membrane lipoprotein-sorting protein